MLNRLTYENIVFFLQQGRLQKTTANSFVIINDLDVNHEYRLMTRPTQFSPLYIQVKNLLIQRLIDKQWTPGMPLPSEFQLAEELHVSQGTVRKALDEMAAEKLVIRRQGKGTYVAEHNQEQSLYHFFRLRDEKNQCHLPLSTILNFDQHNATALEAYSLKLHDNEKVIRIDRIRALAGELIINETITLPARLFPNITLYSELPNTLYRFYQREFGLSVVNVSEKLTAVLADEDDQQRLNIAAGTPLLSALRIAYGLDGTPVELRITRSLTEHYSYFIELT
jgi:GntR family transcriptional regulator